MNRPSFTASFWENSDSQILFNPKDQITAASAESLSKSEVYTPRNGLLWFHTSGTTGLKKWVALSKRAVLHSADAVNRFLDVQKTDVWGLVLPVFHVGGFSILARSYLAGNPCRHSDKKWDSSLLNELSGITLLSLVPAQLHDLLKKEIVPPPLLRAVFIGGGALSKDAYQEAIDKRWPILTTYGMTECASQVATARSPDTPNLMLLPHWEAKTDETGTLLFKGDSLLDGYAFEAAGKWQFQDPKEDGWFRSEDRGSIQGRQLEVWGRGSDFVKILGESVSLVFLRERWAKIKQEHAVTALSRLTVKDHVRKGKEIILEVEKKENSLKGALHAFNIGLPSYLHLFDISEVGKDAFSWKETFE